MRNKFCVFILCIIIAPHISVAQYSFTISTYTTGNCNAYGVDVGSAWRTLSSRIPDGGYIGPFNSKGECESTRQVFLSIPDIYNTNTYAYSNCRIHISATPCTGSGGGVSGSINITGPDQGTSFYTPSSLDEILNWDKDSEQKKMALNSDYEAFYMPKQVSTGDDDYDKVRNKARDDENMFSVHRPQKGTGVYIDDIENKHVTTGGEWNSYDLSMKMEFDKTNIAQDFSLMANKENVERYVDYCKNLADYFIDLNHPFEGDLTMLLHQKFKDISGFDVDDIMRKLPSERNDEEKQALIDYQEFRKEVTENMIEDIDNKIAHMSEIKDFEMAVLAENCYKDSNHSFLSRTNYQKVDTDFFAENTPMRNFSALIDECNSTNSETGFHAEIYYNEKTNEYTIAFEGTNADEYEDLKTDYELGTGKVTEQYKLANRIADFLNNSDFPSDIKINITGHSLGGGLASIVGLSTGKPTYTYNAAGGISDKVIEQFGLKGKSDNNIKAFISEKDQLTNAQEGEYKPAAIGLAVVVAAGEVAAGVLLMGGDRANGYDNFGEGVNIAKEGVRLGSETIKGNVATKAPGEKITLWNDSSHSIKPMVSYLAGPVSQYESIKNNIYEKGHHVEYQTQETILIKTGN